MCVTFDLSKSKKLYIGLQKKGRRMRKSFAPNPRAAHRSVDCSTVIPTIEDPSAHLPSEAPPKRSSMPSNFLLNLVILSSSRIIAPPELPLR